MPLDSGTKIHKDVDYKYNASMSAVMEKTFREEWPTVMGDEADPPASSEQLNLMFRAIAQGVIRHLKENCTSMKVTVTVNVGGNNYTGIGSVTDIDIL